MLISLPYNLKTALSPVRTEERLTDVVQSYIGMRHFSVFLGQRVLGKRCKPEIFLTPKKKLQSGQDEGKSSLLILSR